MILHQERRQGLLTGEFEVLHVYAGNEQQQVTDMFRRMYADGGSSNIFVLMSKATLRESQSSGQFAPESLQTEKFIHASPADQLTRVANKYYSENNTVYVAVVKKTAVQAPIKWEPATGGLYPHIYGPLNMSAVVELQPFFRNEDGNFAISLDI